MEQLVAAARAQVRYRARRVPTGMHHHVRRLDVVHVLRVCACVRVCAGVRVCAVQVGERPLVYSEYNSGLYPFFVDNNDTPFAAAFAVRTMALLDKFHVRAVACA